MPSTKKNKQLYALHQFRRPLTVVLHCTTYCLYVINISKMQGKESVRVWHDTKPQQEQGGVLTSTLPEDNGYVSMHSTPQQAWKQESKYASKRRHEGRRIGPRQKKGNGNMPPAASKMKNDSPAPPPKGGLPRVRCCCLFCRVLQYQFPNHSSGIPLHIQLHDNGLVLAAFICTRFVQR